MFTKYSTIEKDQTYDLIFIVGAGNSIDEIEGCKIYLMELNAWDDICSSDKKNLYLYKDNGKVFYCRKDSRHYIKDKAALALLNEANFDQKKNKEKECADIDICKAIFSIYSIGSKTIGLGFCKKQGVKYLIVGNGTGNISASEIENLPRANNIIVIGHGNMLDEIHTIQLIENEQESLKLVQEIHKKTGAQNILFISCYGGGLIKQCAKRHVFAVGTTLFSPSASVNPSLKNEGNRIVRMFITAISQKKKDTLFCVTADCIKTISETMAIGKQTEQGMKSIFMRRTDRELYVDAEKYINYQLENLNRFIHNNLKLDVEISFEISPIEIEYYHRNSIESHVLHEDIDVIRALIKNNRISVNDIKIIDQTLRILLFPNDFELHSVKANSTELLEFLLEEGIINPNSYMELAVTKGKDKVVNVLLKYGADPDQPVGLKSMLEISVNYTRLDNGLNFKVVKALVDAINISKIDNSEDMLYKLQVMIGIIFSNPKARSLEANELLHSLYKKINQINPENIAQSEIIQPDIIEINFLDKTNFINELIEYHEKASKIENQYLFGLFETNKKNDAIAVTKLLKALHGDTTVIFDDKEIALFYDGDLGSIIEKYRDINVLPSQFLEAESSYKNSQTRLL